MVLFILSAFVLCFGNVTAAEAELGAQLQTSIVVISSKATDKFQPGTKVTLTATVTNVGDLPNAPGEIFIRYVFPKPLDYKPTSEIYKSDTLPLPSIAPGEHVTIKFTKPHLWPSIYDYIRNDWSMREYEAVVNINNVQEVTGTRTITFSAHYYQGSSREKPIRFPSENSAPHTFNMTPKLPSKLLPPPKGN